MSFGAEYLEIEVYIYVIEDIYCWIGILQQVFQKRFRWLVGSYLLEYIENFPRWGAPS